MYNFTDMIQKYVNTNLSPVVKLSSGAYVTCEQFKPWQEDDTDKTGLSFYRNNHIVVVCNIEGMYINCSYDTTTNTWSYSGGTVR